MKFISALKPKNAQKEKKKIKNKRKTKQKQDKEQSVNCVCKIGITVWQQNFAAIY